MTENGGTKHSEGGFKTFLRQNKLLFMQRLGNTLNYAANSSSSLQTAISIEDEEKNSEKNLNEKVFNNAQGQLYVTEFSEISLSKGIMQCYSFIYLFVYLTMIVIGGINVRNCPIDDYLPIWMIVYGCTGIAVGFVFIYLGFPALWSFLLIISVVGIARVYPIYTKVQHINNEELFYCSQSVYLLSFMIITVDIVLFSIIVLYCFAFCACSIAFNLMKNKANFELKSSLKTYLNL